MSQEEASQVGEVNNGQKQPNSKGIPPDEPDIVADIGRDLGLFVERVNSLAEIFPITIAVIQDALTKTSEETTDFIDKHSEVVKEGDEQTKRIVDGYIGELLRWTTKLIRVGLVQDLVPRSFIVSLVSQFDIFVGKLVSAFFYLKPEALNASEKLFSFAQLLDFASIDNAKQYLIEKEVEGVLRQSHSEQFDWFENKLKIPLRKDLHSWPTFIEVTERRNLFVHTGGVVSSQYLKVCRENGVKLSSSLTVGDELRVDAEYFAIASSCIFEIGVKLAQVIWRKLDPSAAKAADGYLVGISYELLQDEKYELAKKLLDFSMLPAIKHPSGVNRRQLIVNRAQAYKWSGDAATATAIMMAEDWGEAREDFQLAAAVLADNSSLAGAIMRKMGNKGQISKSDFREWPLFKEFRKSNDFLEAFESVFGEPFEQSNSVPRNVNDSSLEKS